MFESDMPGGENYPGFHHRLLPPPPWLCIFSVFHPHHLVLNSLMMLLSPSAKLLLDVPAKLRLSRDVIRKVWIRQRVCVCVFSVTWHLPLTHRSASYGPQDVPSTTLSAISTGTSRPTGLQNNTHGFSGKADRQTDVVLIIVHIWYHPHIQIWNEVVSKQCRNWDWTVEPKSGLHKLN